MKNIKKVLLAGTVVGLRYLALDKIKHKMVTDEKDKVDEFYQQDSVKYVTYHADEKVQELLDDLSSEADDHLEKVQKELDDMMTGFIKRQEEHMKKFNKICSGKD